MGLGSYVMAFGLFKPEVADCLEYEKKCYDETGPAALVFNDMFLCQTAGCSHALADALGIDVWDFNTHLIAPKTFSNDATRIRLIDLGFGTDVAEAVRLAQAGFKFVFRPNG